MQGKNDTLKCNVCEYTTKSTSLLTKHKECAHENPANMRTRLSCDICGFKTTSNVVIKRHTETNHRQKGTKASKRKICDICDKRFNKEKNLKQHINKVHKDTRVS